MKKIILSLLISSPIFAAEKINLDQNIHCYSDSARSIITYNVSENKGTFAGSRIHNIECKRSKTSIRCKMPNEDKITISNSKVEFVEQRENLDREVYTLYAIRDSAESLWMCSNR